MLNPCWLRLLLASQKHNLIMRRPPTTQSKTSNTQQIHPFVQKQTWLIKLIRFMAYDNIRHEACIEPAPITNSSTSCCTVRDCMIPNEEHTEKVKVACETEPQENQTSIRCHVKVRWITRSWVILLGKSAVPKTLLRHTAEQRKVGQPCCTWCGRMQPLTNPIRSATNCIQEACAVAFTQWLSSPTPTNKTPNAQTNIILKIEHTTG